MASTRNPDPSSYASIISQNPNLGDETSPLLSDTFSTPDYELSFAPDDPENPRNWPEWRKWSIVLAITLVDFSVSWGASGYSPGQSKMEEKFGVSKEVGILGLSLYILGLSLGPMTLAPLSEYFGRSPIYIISYGIFLIYLVGSALVTNLGGFLILRFFSGMFASVTIANFGGTIADLWNSHETGPAMSIFIWAATAGSPTGFFLFSFVAATRSLEDIFWALLGICSGFWLIMLFTIRETRHSVLLARINRASISSISSPNIPLTKRIRLATSNLLQKALKRPFLFLGTEAIIIFSALYNGYLYGLSFLFNSAFIIVFGPGGHGFTTIQVGLTFLGISTGITIGVVTNAFFQEPYYHKMVRENGGKNTPEGRMLMGKIAGIAFPISLFWFAWTSYVTMPWIIPILAKDSYKTFSASALAGIGFIRNIAGAGFPLFGTQMYHKLGNQGATALLAALACIMVPIPFILDTYGLKLRERSPWARVHIEGKEGDENQDENVKDGERDDRPDEIHICAKNGFDYKLKDVRLIYSETGRCENGI
ncbi:hypothetical protein B7494_g5474 [Chlorociboria aeruginascens]|nr:hypothetical protein B7494_g5474 [Chlorociboria aeruginascens]